MISLASGLLVILGSALQHDAWKEFTGSARFTVTYPAAWRRIGISTDRLDILSSAEFAEGVIIAQNEAEIIVIELPDSAGASLGELIERETQGDSVVSHREVRGTIANNQGCKTLTELVATSEVAPGVHEIDTVFYCEVHGRKFATRLRNWPHDRRQAEYRRIALRVARSLRVPG
jgi:hypothetical protein